FPHPAKVWCNGHEWAKRQAAKAGIAFTALANGFASCSDIVALQAICDSFGPGDIQHFFDHWSGVIPTPFTPADRAAGYWWELSMRQVEVSETLVADNVGIGRPELVCMAFGRQLRSTTREPFVGRIFSPGSDVHLDFTYKHSRVKQYLKEGRALRTETVVNKPWDLNILARIEHLPELVDKARQVNARLL